MLLSRATTPLQDRTADQLKDGMFVTVRGAGSADLAVARLIQDGAAYMALVADTTVGLATVEINYASADKQGALGLATFQGTKGWFALSQRSTKGLLEGIERLRATPWTGWSESQRQAFVQANETILHEAAPPGRSGEAVGVRILLINGCQTIMPLLFGMVGTLGMLPVFWATAGFLIGGGWLARQSRRTFNPTSTQPGNPP